MNLTIGILSFAHPHVHSYAAYVTCQPGVRVIGTDTGDYDPGTVRGADLSAQLGIEYRDDVESVLAQAPDAVVICSDNASHRELTEQALAAGAHVLCEKPLATTDADAAAMVAAAKRTGKILMTAYPVRFSPVFADLVTRYRAGQLGEILSVHATNNGKMPTKGERSWFTDPARSGGGALVDHVVHVADLLDELLGEQCEEVHAMTNRIIHPDAGVETGGVVSARYPSGVIAEIDCSWSMPDSAPSWGGLTLEVHGTKGSMRIDPFAAHVGGYAADGAVWHAFGDNLDGPMIGTFIDAVRTGEVPQPDGHVGARTLGIVTAAQRSIATGRPQRVFDA